MYRRWTFGLLLVNLVWALVQLVRAPSAGGLIRLGIVVAIITWRPDYPRA